MDARQHALAREDIQVLADRLRRDGERFGKLLDRDAAGMAREIEDPAVTRGDDLGRSGRARFDGRGSRQRPNPSIILPPLSSGDSQ
jgi:hypothetical protein